MRSHRPRTPPRRPERPHGPPPSPPAGAVVLARQADDLAIALALAPGRGHTTATVTALAQDGTGAAVDVSIGGEEAATCGSGCFRTELPSPPPRRIGVEVARPGRPTRTIGFRRPLEWPAPPATALAHAAARAFRGLRTVTIHETLAADAGHVQRTVFQLAAPNKLSYRIAHGPSGIVIGGDRWDRTGAGPWKKSPQTPLPQPTPFWQSVADAHLIAEERRAGRRVDVVSFYDRAVPAWFTVRIDARTRLPRRARDDRGRTLHAPPLQPLRREHADPPSRRTRGRPGSGNLSRAGSSLRVGGAPGGLGGFRRAPDGHNGLPLGRVASTGRVAGA